MAVRDEADYVSAFMSLHRAQQAAALSVVFAADALSDPDDTEDLLRRLAAPTIPLPDTTRHFMDMVANVVRAPKIARHAAEQQAARDQRLRP